MANVRVAWVLPTTRVSKKPLAVGDINHVRIELSADGTNFGTVDRFAPDVLQTTLQDLDYGTWTFRGVVVDKEGRESDPAVASLTIEDNTPPSMLAITLELL